MSGLALFVADAGVTAVAAWLLARASPHSRHGVLELLVAWLWSFVAIIAGTGVILGVTGGFGPVGFAASHGVVLVAAGWWRRRESAEDRRALANIPRQFQAVWLTEPALKWLTGLIGTALVVLAVLALVAEPAVMDALNYHLPRLAHWLQEGRIGLIGAGDERLDYIAGLPEVVMAWLLGPVPAGFRGIVAIQAIGGLLTMGATIGLARCSGLSRQASLLAGGLLLGMGNVIVQFTAAQTDLFTAGMFASAFYLWIMALRRGEVSLPGTMGAGLALAAKGTVFYLAPSALLWVVGLVGKQRPARRFWVRSVLGGVAGVVLFAAPGLGRNWQAYGDIRGPARWIREFHPPLPTWRAKTEKLGLNAISFLAQSCDPQSQPSGLQSTFRKMGEGLVALLPVTDPYTFIGQDRRGVLGMVLQRTRPDADTVSFGGLGLGLLVLGTVLAVARGRRGRRELVGWWAAGVWLFFIFFNFLHQWHPFAFRYYVLIAPWLAVVGAWTIEQAGGRWRTVTWILVGLASLNVGWRITTGTHQAGWQTVAYPERTIGYRIASGWREWSENLDDVGHGWSLGLADDRPLAAFYRQVPARPVEVLPAASLAEAPDAESLVRGRETWVIVPATRFLGREGRVMARSWIFRGAESDPYSLVAYRALHEGEVARSFLYRQRWSHSAGRRSCDLLVKQFDTGETRLVVANPAGVPRRFTWQTPVAHGTGSVDAHGRAELLLPLPAGAVAQVRLDFDDDALFAQAPPDIGLAE